MVTKQFHEIRDPIHVFIILDRDERRVLDSKPVQRLRHIHQLAMSYLVYPGATHRRFEHSLGVMELAGRVFDVITAEQNIHDSVRKVVPEIATRPDSRAYWRKVLRMAALCHDIGHLPFSHAAEHELLPEGWNHERITTRLILSEEMREIWDSMVPPLNVEHIAKVAVGREKAQEADFTNGLNWSDWEILLSEIIGGDTLGVDRMDYLLRDSYHAGVAYGRFDHHRLIDTLRVLPHSDHSDEPTLGIESGGIYTAEALLLARYYMFMQVYQHRVRVAYDHHLKEFLSSWLSDGSFPYDVEGHQGITDNEVLSAISKASEDESSAGHQHAKRIMERRHFRPIYTLTRPDKEKYGDSNPLQKVFNALSEEYGSENLYMVPNPQGEQDVDFPVLNSAGGIMRSRALSEILHRLPTVDARVVLIAPERVEEATKWFDGHRDTILSGS